MSAERAHARPKVVFARSGLTVEWDPACESLLELAQVHDLNPPFSCRVGVCNSCLSRLVEGEVEYFQDLLIPPRSGEVLLCCSRPRTPRVVVDA